jgi:NAD(P)-dependent dehydrogenase (short-subunit alcohol dehydrogenase family)
MRNQVALVTGGGRGIGRGIALALAEAGYDLAVNYQGNREAADQVSEQGKALGVRVEVIQADISVGEDRTRLMADVERLFGRLDILVNNAGVTVQNRTDLLEGTEESFDRVLDINLKGTYFLTQKAAKWMINQVKADPERSPKIVMISSAAAFKVLPTSGEYCVSKAGLGMVTQLFAARLANEGIAVFEIRPGVIETDITAAFKSDWDGFVNSGKIPIRRWGSPADVAKAVVAITSGLFPYSTGEVFHVDGGIHIPRF